MRKFLYLAMTLVFLGSVGFIIYEIYLENKYGSEYSLQFVADGKKNTAYFYVKKNSTKLKKDDSDTLLSTWRIDTSGTTIDNNYWLHVPDCSRNQGTISFRREGFHIDDSIDVLLKETKIRIFNRNDPKKAYDHIAHFMCSSESVAGA